MFQNAKSTLKKKSAATWVPMAHAYNPRYSEDRGQEDCGSKPALGK
jgi:hypothetical protein